MLNRRIKLLKNTTTNLAVENSGVALLGELVLRAGEMLYLEVDLVEVGANLWVGVLQEGALTVVD